MQDYPKVSDKELNRILKQCDDTAYEQRRFAASDLLSRSIARYVLLPGQFCRYRRCRRSLTCLGPSVPTQHLRDKVAAQRLIGLQGMAYRTLPQCLANLTQSQFAKTYSPMEKQMGDGALSEAEWRFHRAVSRINGGAIIRTRLGCRIGPDLAKEVANDEFDAVLKVTTPLPPPEDPDIPGWIQQLDWQADTDPTRMNVLWPRGRLVKRR